LAKPNGAQNFDFLPVEPNLPDKDFTSGKFWTAFVWFVVQKAES